MIYQQGNLLRRKSNSLSMHNYFTELPVKHPSTTGILYLKGNEANEIRIGKSQV